MPNAKTMMSRGRTSITRDIPVTVGGIIGVIVLSRVLSGSGLTDATTAAVTAMVLISLGILTGAGITCLCQLSFAAIGAWTVSQLSLWATTGGLLVWTLIGGAVASVFGVIIGLTALRLRGVQLAIITLAFGALVDSVFTAKGFPGSTNVTPVTVPQFLFQPADYLVFAGCALAAVALAAVVFFRTRAGRALRCLRQSERATAAIGCDVARTKLVAFGVSAGLAGIAGGVEAGQSGISVASTFAPVQSLSLVALAIVIGVEYIDGAVIGAVLATVVPNLLAYYGLPSSWSLMIVGVLTIPALRSEIPPGEKLRFALYQRSAGRGRRRSIQLPLTAAPLVTPMPPHRTALEVAHLTVRYGPLVAVDDVSLSARRGEVVGLIGPNGAGKSTLVDVVSGFVHPQDGRVHVDANELDGRPPYIRARRGLRRTFQQDRIPLGLYVDQYLRLAAARGVSDADVHEVLDVVGGPDPRTPIALLDVGTRRLVEVAGGLLARPTVLMLDEPTAGLGLDAKNTLGARLPTAALRYDVAIVLIEHDLDLVRAACARSYVLDHGQLLAEGTPDEVLRDEAVHRAYLGDEAEL